MQRLKKDLKTLKPFLQIGGRVNLKPIKKLIIAYLRKWMTRNGAISRRYDGITGGRYLMTAAAIYKDGYISEEYISGFQDNSKDYIKRWLEF